MVSSWLKAYSFSLEKYFNVTATLSLLKLGSTH